MVAICILAAVVQTEAKTQNPTVLDLLKNMHGTYRDLHSFQDRWTFENKGEVGPTFDGEFDRSIQGKQFAFKWHRQNMLFFEEAYDGKTHVMVMHPSSQYVLSEKEPTQFAEKFQVAPPEDPTDTFTFSVTAYDFKVWMKPWPVFEKQTVETFGEDKLRRFDYITGTNEKGRMSFWFESDRWIVRRFELQGKSAEGKKVHLITNVKVTRRPLGDATFTIPYDSFKGFQRIDPP